MTMKLATRARAIAGFVALAACSGGEPASEAPETGDPRASAEAPEATADLASLTGNASAGEAVFRRCMACHSVAPGQNRVGPSLHRVVGSDIGSVGGFGYSSANQAADGDWTPGALFAYLESPREFMPGTTMAFAGIPDAQDRANLIAYLETQN